MNWQAFTAGQILAVPVTTPAQLFSGADRVEAEYRSLLKKWHPDKCSDPEASDVISHLTKLRQAAKEHAERGIWVEPNTYVVRAVAGSTHKFHYKRRVQLECGELFYGFTSVLYSIDADFADLVHAGVKNMNAFKFADSRMRKEMERFLPQIERVIETTDRRFNILIPKTRDVFSLSDVLQLYSGKLPAAHVAWMLNGVFNIACYLEYSGLTHNAITLENVFVSPLHHSALLLGGWWYSVRAGDRLSALPRATHSVAPADLLASKRADSKLDLASIRALGRTLLGDPSGMALNSIGVPAPMVTFLRMPPGLSARVDYAAWHSAVKASFGPRKFIELAVTENQIFNL